MSVFDAVQVARVTAEAEAGLLAAYEWMPYPSDIEDEAIRHRLNIGLERVKGALEVVRDVRKEAERQIVAEATA